MTLRCLPPGNSATPAAETPDTQKPNKRQDREDPEEENTHGQTEPNFGKERRSNASQQTARPDLVSGTVQNKRLQRPEPAQHQAALFGREP